MTQPQQDAAADAVAGIAAALEVQRAAVAGVLAQDPVVAPEVLLELARAVDGVVRSSHGLLVQILARMDEVKAVRGGVTTWLTAQLGYSPGRARGLASDARRLRALPEVTEQLTCGVLPVGAERVLARAAQAAVSTERDTAETVADTLDILQRDGMQAAEREVRHLEHTVQPGKAEQDRARQRTASFLRLSTCESGMLRLDALLDIERGTVVRAAIDTLTSTWLRERQYDHTNPCRKTSPPPSSSTPKHSSAWPRSCSAPPTRSAPNALPAPSCSTARNPDRHRHPRKNLPRPQKPLIPRILPQSPAQPSPQFRTAAWRPATTNWFPPPPSCGNPPQHSTSPSPRPANPSPSTASPSTRTLTHGWPARPNAPP
jgi:hypothetical protein